MNSMKRQKDDQKMNPSSLGVSSVLLGEEQRAITNYSRKTEVAGLAGNDAQL